MHYSMRTWILSLRESVSMLSATMHRCRLRICVKMRDQTCSHLRQDSRDRVLYALKRRRALRLFSRRYENPSTCTREEDYIHEGWGANPKVKGDRFWSEETHSTYTPIVFFEPRNPTRLEGECRFPMRDRRTFERWRDCTQATKKPVKSHTVIRSYAFISMIKTTTRIQFDSM